VEAQTLANGLVIEGTYRIVRLLGRGGMGEVYEARHQRTGAGFALKVLQAAFASDPDLLARFKREAEVTSNLNHPNIVRVFDFDVLPDGRPFLAMELLEGSELAAVIQQGRGPMPLGRVLPIIEQVALGLSAAHAKGIVHRDLKPANIFVTPLAGTARQLVRILDFGISKVRDARSHLTKTAAVIGTPNYMSPEQAMGHTALVDATTDQWALAAIAYELLTGQMAFSSDEGAVSVLLRVVSTEPLTFAELGVTVPAGVEAVVRRGLTKDKGQRFPSVAAFARELARAARAAGIVAEARDLDEEAGAEEGLGPTQVLPVQGPGPSPALPGTTLGSSVGERSLSLDGPPAGSRRRAPLLIAGGVAALAAALVFTLVGSGPKDDGRPPHAGTGAAPPVAATPPAAVPVSPPAAVVPPAAEAPPAPPPAPRPNSAALAASPAPSGAEGENTAAARPGAAPAPAKRAHDGRLRRGGKPAGAPTPPRAAPRNEEL
jgi:serine/threonine-protein kinase